MTAPRYRGSVTVTFSMEGTLPDGVHVMDWSPGMVAALAGVKALKEYPGIHPETVTWGAEERNLGVVEPRPGQMSLLDPPPAGARGRP